MGKYSIEFSKKAAKSYARLPKDYKALVDMALHKLTEGIPLDVKPLQGEKDIYRIRIGKYRLLFTLIDNVIIIVNMGSRGDIYKELH